MLKTIFQIMFVVCVIGAYSNNAQAGFIPTDKADHQGWAYGYGTDPDKNKDDPKSIVPAQWNPVEIRCHRCYPLSSRYNAAQQGVLDLRYQREINRRRKASLKQEFERRRGKEGLSPDKAAPLIALHIELTEVLDAEAARIDAELPRMEQMAEYLRARLSECEGFCPPSTETDPPPMVPYLPDDLPEIATLNFDWTGPYRDDCPKCERLVRRLNELPHLAHDRQVPRQNAVNEIANLRVDRRMAGYAGYSSGYRDSEQINKRIEELQETIALIDEQLAEIKRNFDKTLALYNDCIKTCPQNACPKPPADKPVTVGSNSEVGSGARLGQKAKETVTNAIGGLLGGGGGGGGLFGGGGGGGLFGGGGGGSDVAKGPDTGDDPVADDDKATTSAGGASLKAGAALTDDGLTFSTEITDAADEGTFQAVVFEDSRGRRLIPYRYVIYSLWAEWTLTVSWTYDRYVDGQHVEHKEGGWSESWTEDLGTFAALFPREGEKAGIWYELGFDNASHGVQNLGSLFKVTKDDFANGPINAIVHVTKPGQDPVTTIPFVFELSLVGDRIITKPVNSTLASRQGCYDTATK